MKAVVAGGIATFPVGGVAWDYGQYALGLERLGFEVYYLEDTGMYGYDPITRGYSEDCSYGARFLGESLVALSPAFEARWHLRSAAGETFGMDPSDFAEIIAEADIFLNVSGLCLLRDAYMRCQRKVLIDTDPGWNHFVVFPKWDANPGWQGSHGFRAHDYFFTYAQRIGLPDCPLPALGLTWRPTRPPVVLDCWRRGSPGQKWTTVMTWNNYERPIEHGGVTYGTKELEFVRVETLPSQTPVALEIAIGGVRPPVARLRGLGWSVVDSTRVSATLESYRSYIQGSRGEFSVAKNFYVATRSGWFSCRSVCYLAAGRPVIVQDTGFADLMPTGEGLIAFSGLEDAVRGIDCVERDYAFHQQAAHELARSHFDSNLVLGDLVNQIGLA